MADVVGMPAKVTLTWAKPIELEKWSNLTAKEANVPGVYIWIWKNGPLRIYYVGESFNVFKRQLEHVHFILGGMCWVFKPKDGEDFYSFWKRNIEVTKDKSFSGNNEILAPNALSVCDRKIRSDWGWENIGNSMISWAKFGKPSERDLRRVLEAGLNEQVRKLLGPSYEINNVVPGHSDNPHKIKLIHEGDEVVKSLFDMK